MVAISFRLGNGAYTWNTPVYCWLRQKVFSDVIKNNFVPFDSPNTHSIHVVLWGTYRNFCNSPFNE